jgi:small subunit ribosomal protein S13
MIYLFKSKLLKNKLLCFALISSLHGLGKVNIFYICKKLGFSKNLAVKNLSKEQINKLVKTIEFLHLPFADDLLKVKSLVIKKLIFIKSYKGLRRYQGLPVRGQRTHTNAKTSRKQLT